MKKLLLLDADVIIDLHTLRLFNKMTKAYQIKVTRTVLGEARYFPRGDKKIKINIEDQVEVIDGVSIESIRMATLEAKEAMLIVDPGETESIGYLIDGKEDISLCLCDKAIDKENKLIRPLLVYYKSEKANATSKEIEKALESLDKGLFDEV